MSEQKPDVSHPSAAIAKPLTDEFRDSLTRTADWLENLLTEQRAGPGKNYTQPRTIQVDVWDNCDAGGESVDGFTFDDGEVEFIVALLRAALVASPSSASAITPQEPEAWLGKRMTHTGKTVAAMTVKLDRESLRANGYDESEIHPLYTSVVSHPSPDAAITLKEALEAGGKIVGIEIRSETPRTDAAITPDEAASRAYWKVRDQYECVDRIVALESELAAAEHDAIRWRQYQLERAGTSHSATNDNTVHQSDVPATSIYRWIEEAARLLRDDGPRSSRAELERDKQVTALLSAVPTP